MLNRWVLSRDWKTATEGAVTLNIFVLVLFWWAQAVQRAQSYWRSLSAGRSHNSPRNAIHTDFSRKVVSRFCFQLTVRSTYVSVGR